MQASWSVIINVLLLIGIFIAIARMLGARRKQVRNDAHQPFIGSESSVRDEIISVRKVPAVDSQLEENTPKISPVREEPDQAASVEAKNTLMMFLLAKENGELAGYELLQTILAAGLRFGEGHLFHRHQQANGQGPVLCSLAAATPSGVFDLQNIGAFRVRGLCLFMEASGNPVIDDERFTIMLETAKRLSENLDAYLLDEKRQPLTEESIARYHGYLNIQ